MPQYITMSHTVFTDINFFQTDIEKIRPHHFCNICWRTRKNLPLSHWNICSHSTCSTLKQCSNTEPDGLCSCSIMLYPRWRSSNNQVARKNKTDISCSFEVITIIITPPRKGSLLQAFLCISSSWGHHPPSSQYFGTDRVYICY